MTNTERPGKTNLTVMGSSEAPSSYGRQALADGTAEIAAGGIVAGGFGVEAAKGLIESEATDWWWFFGGFLLGISLVTLGLLLRERSRKNVRVGIVVSARDPRSGSARFRQVEQQAEAYSRSSCAVTMKIEASLPTANYTSRSTIDNLTEEALSAIAMAERLTPDASRINLVPTMPPHAAFWLGARIGCMHAREVAVHAIRQGSGTPAYFPAVSLRADHSNSSAPLTIDRLEAIDDGKQYMAALAIDLEGRRDQFVDHVRTACRKHKIGYLLTMNTGSAPLKQTKKDYSDAVVQVCKSWLNSPLPTVARTGHHYIFFSGPEAVALALGARLASAEYSRWTAFAFDENSYSYVPFLMTSVDTTEKLKETSKVKESATPKETAKATQENDIFQEAGISDPWRASLKLTVGDRVRHEKYGLGDVISVDGKGPRTTATVDFGKNGTVRLMLIAGVPLTKVNP